MAYTTKTETFNKAISGAVSKPNQFQVCRNCGFGTKRLYELEKPIKNKRPLPIYAVCKTCLEKEKEKE